MLRDVLKKVAKFVVRREIANHLLKANGIRKWRTGSAPSFQYSSRRYRKCSDPQAKHSDAVGGLAGKSYPHPSPQL